MRVNLTIRLGSLMGIVLLFMSGCYYDQVIPKTINTNDVGEMSFVGDIVPIFNESCNVSGCHNKGGIKPDLTATDAYDVLTAGGYLNTDAPASSILYKWMNGEESLPMPLSGANANYNVKVLAWIEQGALNN